MGGDVMSGKIRTIAFEGLDSSGKGTTIKKLEKLIQCKCWVTKKNMPEEDALRKKNTTEFDEGQELLDFLIKSYRKESFRIKSLMEKNPDTVILLDRCFVTPAAIRYATRNDVPNWNPDWFERICENWEDGVLKPDLIFTIRVDEKLRVERMRKRAEEEEGKEINEREQRLIDDDDYREDTLDAELKLGCIPLRIRDRSPEVVAMRALQNLLGRKEYHHHPA